MIFPLAAKARAVATRFLIGLGCAQVAALQRQAVVVAVRLVHQVPVDLGLRRAVGLTVPQAMVHPLV